MISGTEDQRPNVITKDAPVALLSEEMPRVFMSCELGTTDEDQICEKKYPFGHSDDQMDISDKS